MNGVGEPCAGEPHARFEVAGAEEETQMGLPQVLGCTYICNSESVPDPTPEDALAGVACVVEPPRFQVV